MPVLLLFGDDEVIYSPVEALARARRLIPRLEADLVPGCRHDMCFSQFRIVDARVLDFLRNTDGEQAETVRRSIA
jgi:pimeloyl-ACP methyl ester carboxylesterase